LALPTAFALYVPYELFLAATSFSTILDILLTVSNGLSSLCLNGLDRSR
jgi:hypothetical protein